MKEIHRVLKPDGLFAMVEVDSSGNCYVEKTTKGPLAALFYANSLFRCLPVGANTEGMRLFFIIKKSDTSIFRCLSVGQHVGC